MIHSQVTLSFVEVTLKSVPYRESNLRYLIINWILDCVNNTRNKRKCHFSVEANLGTQ